MAQSLGTDTLQIEPTGRSLEAAQPIAAKQLRVLHVVNRLDLGGTELVMLRVIRGLTSSKVEHSICSMRGVDSASRRLPSAEGKIFAAGQAEAGFQFPLFRLVQVMRAYHPHIVHSRNWGAIEAIPAARIARVPIVVHSEHGYDLEMLRGIPYRRRWFRRVAYRMADAVFTVSQELRDFHASQVGLQPGAIRVIYNGVDTEVFAPRPESRRAVRQALSLPGEAFVIGTVGRVVPIKDHSTLLRAAEALVCQGVDVRALVVGSGPDLARLRRSTDAPSKLNGKVLFVGSSDQVPELLNAMDAFVLTSISEGMSNTLLEATACGLPVIATRVGGNPEIVEDNETGWLFSPGDVDTLAEFLGRLAGQTELRRRIGDAARRRTQQHFGLDKMVEAYRHLYFELLERRRIPSAA